MTRVIIYDTITGKPIGLMEKAESHRLAREANNTSEEQPHKHLHLGVLLYDANGNLLTSRRDFLADSNASLVDKSIGGHVPGKYTSATALLQIASREFQIPTAIVSRMELESIIKNHPELLKRQAFVTEIDYMSDFDSVRVIKDGSSWNEICMQQVFLGVYDGLYKSTARTSIMPIDQANLLKYVTENPAGVTEDLKIFLLRYNEQAKALQHALHVSRTANHNTAEVIEYYTMDGTLVDTISRKEVHKPIMKTFLADKPQQHKHRHIGGLLVGDEGQVYVQIRSENKSENPGMYDKLVGGHIPYGDSPIVAAYHEFIEEMAIPIALYDELTWLDILKNCHGATNIQAICKEPILVTNFVSRRERRDGKSFNEICDQYLTIGRYQKSFQFVDKEAAGVYQFPSREELRTEMESHPTKFTGDLKYMVDKFWDDLVPLNQLVN